MRSLDTTADTEAETEPAAEPEADDTEADTSTEDAEAKERAARAAASIKEREKEVQRALGKSLRDRDKERQHHQRDEGVQHFNALLADLVRNAELSWRDAKKQLKKDHRYALADLLSKEEKERLFSSHISTLALKRRDKLRAILAELNVACDATWTDVKGALKEHPNAPSYGSSSQMEREFREWVRDKQSQAKAAFRQLLAETRTFSHKSRAAVAENSSVLQGLLAPIIIDPRYTALDHIPEERAALVDKFLDELEKRGPPPPPTATEPTRQRK